MAESGRTTRVKSHKKIKKNEIRLMTINMNTAKDKTTGKMASSEDRRMDINKLLKNEKFDIIMAQEIAAPGRKNWLLDHDEYQYFSSEKEAGIMVSADFDDCEVIDAGLKTRIFDSMRGCSGNDKAELVARTCIVLIKNIQSKRHLLCVSYHGPYKARDKQTLIDLLQDFVIRIKRKKQVTDIVIGGDFNMDMEGFDGENREFASGPVLYKLSKRRQENGGLLIDSFLCSNDLQIDEDETRTLQHGNYCRSHDGWTLDHDPVATLLRFKTAEQTSKNARKPTQLKKEE